MLGLIDLNSDIFDEMRTELDSAIVRVVKEIYDGNFKGGDISLKLSIDTETDFTEVPDGLGGVTNEPYKKPFFIHSIGVTLQKKDSIKGHYVAEGKQIELMNDKYVLKEVEQAQIDWLD